MNAYETPADRIRRLHVEIGQYRIIDRNHREMCADEIRKRQTEIEILLAADVKQEAKAEAGNG